MQKRYFCTIFAVANKGNRSHDHLTIHRGVEQLAARRAHNPEAGGSSPPPATIEEIRKGFLFFCLCLQALLLHSPRATVVGGNVCKHPKPPTTTSRHLWWSACNHHTYGLYRWERYSPKCRRLREGVYPFKKNGLNFLKSQAETTYLSK